MKIIRRVKNLKSEISNIKNLGFVPTMGSFHKGHISLIRKSLKKCNKTLISIYVNPTQFNNKKDFSTYPRNIKKDLNKIRNLNVDIVFIPKTSEIYSKKIKNKNIVIQNKNKVLCAKYRKGHFEGVINVVDRLLSIVKPNYMFLGEKDFQQFFLIKKYIKNKFKTRIVLCKTVRDKRYIALSSRNKLLTKKNLTVVSKISIELNFLKRKIKKNFKNINKINYYKNLISKKI